MTAMHEVQLQCPLPSLQHIVAFHRVSPALVDAVGSAGSLFPLPVLLTFQQLGSVVHFLLLLFWPSDPILQSDSEVLSPFSI